MEAFYIQVLELLPPYTAGILYGIAGLVCLWLGYNRIWYSAIGLGLASVVIGLAYLWIAVYEPPPYPHISGLFRIINHVFPVLFLLFLIELYRRR